MLKKSENFDIIFEAAEDICNNSKTQILLLKNCYKIIPIAKPRQFQSYCYEFCGIVGSSYSTLRFLIGGRDVNPEICLMSNCHVKVLHTSEFNLQPPNSLKTSFLTLLNSGIFSDITLKLDNELIKAHKCILVSRSPKFNAMFTSNLMETQSNVVNVECKNLELFKCMLQWMYCGEIKFPENIFEVFDLMLLADEYLINDLKQKCEEDMLAKLNETNLLKMLVLAEKHPLVNNAITDRCKTLFIEDFDKIYKLNPDIEQQIQSIPGLMVKLFHHIHSKKNMKRKVTFVFEN